MTQKWPLVSVWLTLDLPPLYQTIYGHCRFKNKSFRTRNHNIQNPLILLIASRAISLGFFHTPLNVRSVAGARHSVPTDLVARDGREFCQVE